MREKTESVLQLENYAYQGSMKHSLVKLNKLLNEKEPVKVNKSQAPAAIISK